MLSLLVGGLLVTGCGGVNPARTPPRPPVERVQLDPFGLFQELCPSSSAPLQSTNHSCDARDLAAYARRLAAFGRDNWYPGELAKRQYLYGNFYAGRALTTVVHMRIDSVGQIADSGIQYSSGSDTLDSLGAGRIPSWHPGARAADLRADRGGLRLPPGPVRAGAALRRGWLARVARRHPASVGPGGTDDAAARAAPAEAAPVRDPPARPHGRHVAQGAGSRLRGLTAGRLRHPPQPAADRVRDRRYRQRLPAVFIARPVNRTRHHRLSRQGKYTESQSRSVPAALHATLHSSRGSFSTPKSTRLRILNTKFASPAGLGDDAGSRL